MIASDSIGEQHALFSDLVNVTESLRIGAEAPATVIPKVAMLSEALKATNLSNEQQSFLSALSHEAETMPAVSSPGTVNASATKQNRESTELAIESPHGEFIQQQLEDDSNMSTARAEPFNALPSVEKPTIPLRNSHWKGSAHVTPFSHAGGLVHGGVVETEHFRLVVRSFRWFKHRIEVKNLFKGISHSYLYEEVAGICEQFDMQGNLMKKWTTASTFPNQYDQPVSKLPERSCLITSSLKNGLIFKFEGYYLPERPNRIPKMEAPKGSLEASKAFPDTGVLNKKFYGAKAASQLFGQTPDMNMAVENALFTAPSIQPSTLFPINTPYLRVFCPSPNMDEVVVCMVGAQRNAITKGKSLKTFNRNARWHAHTFFKPTSS